MQICLKRIRAGGRFFEGEENIGSSVGGGGDKERVNVDGSAD